MAFFLNYMIGERLQMLEVLVKLIHLFGNIFVTLQKN